jgi:hypothetical protein
MPYRERILPTEWRTLQFAPLWVFVTVAGTDGDIDARELRALTAQLAREEHGREPLVKEIFSAAAQDFARLVPDFGYDSRTLQEGLADVCKVLEMRVPPTEARAFKNALLSLRYDIAEAAGAKLRGSRASEREKKALEFVAECLKTPLGEEHMARARQPHRFSHLTPWLPRFLVALPVVLLLAFALYQWAVYWRLPQADPGQNRPLYLGLAGCLAVPAVILTVFAVRFMSRFSRPAVRTALTVATLVLAFVCCGAPVGAFAVFFVPPPTTEISAVVSGSEQTVVDEEFEIVVEIINKASREQELAGIDFTHEALQIIGAEPAYTAASSIFGTDTYEFGEIVPANGNLVISFRGVMTQRGSYDIPVNVCIRFTTRCQSYTWHVEVVEE